MDKSSENPSTSAFDDFVNHLDLPETDCDQVHPVVEQFVGSLKFSDLGWTGTLSDWMEQANSCLATELSETLGEPPTDPDEFDQFMWAAIRISWLFYRKFNNGEPFNS